MSHPYATDSRERERVPLLLAGLSIASAFAFEWLMRTLEWSLPFWVDAPSTLASYGLYFQLFRKVLWKWSIWRKLALVTVPPVGGCWKGFVLSSHDEQKNKHEIEIDIVQDWTHMSVTLRSAYSQSHSLIGSIITLGQTVIGYEYLNEPRTDAVQTMHTHRGTARLALSADGCSLEGEYYSGRDRINYGSIQLKRNRQA
jgi:hypothetical protein